MSAMGLNAVRIPLPWYAFGSQNEHESYISCIDYIDRAMEWANKYEMKVLLDLATVPGGQGDSNSSATTSDIVADWHSSANGRATALEVLERLAEDLKPFATVESQPKLEGRNMLMLLAPIKGAFDNEGESEPSDK